MSEEGKTIIEGPIGKVAQGSVKFEGMKFVAEILADTQFVDAGVVVKIDAEAALLAIKPLIKGEIDDMVIDGIIALLKNLK